MGDVLRIAICDDEEIIRYVVKEKCEHFLMPQGIKHIITLYHNGMELLQSVDDWDILFLDVDMPNINGFSVAEAIRKRGLNIYIIFLTSYAEMMQKAFKVKAFRYLIKPVNESEIFEALREARKEIINYRTILIQYKNEGILVNEKDILYVESLGDVTSVFVKDNYYISTKTLVNWQIILNDELFYKTHKSYIVGFGHIKRIENYIVIMKNGNEVPISRRKIKDFQERVKGYIRLMAR
jgi:DNA-binding LytR/AlgR family response regulator